MLKSKVIITRPEALQRELNDFFIQVQHDILKEIKFINISSNTKIQIMAIIIYEETGY